ncbi:PEP/pyruvate-binding domain-containing protein [Aquimarina intermedia]|uniref:Phosphoenolpyruvate synthase n=1 Tax=Aquimarina intermedia TaxID=350814 RepID=A0A5S5C9L5_9FLAO|nr:PEP/pyruvate-binding domain-containing protein [Aquimarina intermedia]TYP75066.1 pyruvate phosphate dikinase-like enzyme [Aquimarina intermedia]
MINKQILITLSVLLIYFPSLLQSQDLPTNKISQLVEDLKKDRRGPYHRIKWFCKDGSIREPRDPCPDSIGGGIQHASYKDIIEKNAKEHHLFFGDILAFTDPSSFWDEKNAHSRLKQYQLARYLSSVDDGWILRKGRYYRGSVQSEDEEAWGIDFYKWLLTDNERIINNYYVIRQSLRDIPHDGDNNLAQQMRSESKVIADEFPDFMDLRVKIHGQPGREDIALVQNFRQQYATKLTPELNQEFEKLEKTLLDFYAPVDFDRLKRQINKITTDTPTKQKILTFLEEYKNEERPENMVPVIADLLYAIREHSIDFKGGANRLILLDFSNELENILLRKSQEWKPDELQGLLDKIQALTYAAAGTGLVELWECTSINSLLENYTSQNKLSIGDLTDFLETSRSILEWSTAMVKSKYEHDVNTYGSFEPKAYGFIDDRIRSSIALSMGESISRLGILLAEKTSLTNAVLTLSNQSSFRGLNPGYAYGELVVVEGTEEVEVNSDKIYVFQKPPSDLKPVAGIMTVAEGNLVSHVQLLARNLGIPNAALSDINLQELEAYSGQKVFYAVSNKGNVILKLEKNMSPQELALFEKEQRNTDLIEVPVDQIQLKNTSVLSMRNVNAKDSGKLCGPKAANLGQLKQMFPDHVVEGLVIPFGIFRTHMDQKMPNTEGSFWEFLNTMFAEASTMRSNAKDEKLIEEYQLQQLKTLREAIIKMPLSKEFTDQLKNQFTTIFGGSMGSVPVFLRSDTNMEDLKEFTGAGLNLTLFNIISENNIIEGIKKVWASPYTERSFKWRQKYLSNPENVYPSILIIPSVDVEYSGVMITKGINSGNHNDLTVAFSKGAGGAVDGQAAETRLITKSDDKLLAPSRETHYIRLPSSGGTKKYHTTFETPILNTKNIEELRKIASIIKKTIPEETASDYKGAYDVELGFKDDKLWLFQIRPFVENKRALSSAYLQSITPEIDYSRKLALTTKI